MADLNVKLHPKEARMDAGIQRTKKSTSKIKGSILNKSSVEIGKKPLNKTSTNFNNTSINKSINSECKLY